ncbi:MAG: nicotinate-nucleotide adenylyltransferase [Candidatus Hodarchaeota archaeon]
MQDKEIKYEIGVIHGRFQILHNDHMKYLLAGKALCNHLIIGLTNPDPFLTRDSKTNPDRSTPLANPMSYYERFVMIQEAFKEKGFKLSEFSVVPFPINIPELIKYYVPMDAVFFLSIYDDWGRKKKKNLESLGLNVHVLWEVSLEEKGLSSSDIRDAMINNKPWEHLVPSIVVKLMKEWHIINRLKEISLK